MSGNDQGNPSVISGGLEDCQLRARRLQRWGLLLVWMVTLALCPILAAQLSLGATLGTSPNPSIWGLVNCIGMFVATIFVVVGLIAGLSHLSDRFGWDCVGCRKRIIAGDLNFTIAMHGCPHCSHGLFPAEDSLFPPSQVAHPDPIVGRFTLVEIRESELQRNRAFVKSLIPVIIAVGTCCAIGMVAIPGIQQIDNLRFDHQAIPIAKAFLVSFAVMAFGIGLLISMRRASKVSTARCPGCNCHIQVSRILRLTGRCDECGSPLLRDPQLGQSDCRQWGTPTIDRAEFASQLRQHRNLMVYLAFLFVGLGSLAWIAVMMLAGRNSLDGPMTSTDFVKSIFGIFTMVGLLGWAEQRSRMRLCCNHCHQSLLTSPLLTKATGNCVHCGRSVLIPSAGSHQRGAIHNGSKTNC